MYWIKPAAFVATCALLFTLSACEYPETSEQMPLEQFFSDNNDMRDDFLNANHEMKFPKLDIEVGSFPLDSSIFRYNSGESAKDFDILQLIDSLPARGKAEQILNYDTEAYFAGKSDHGIDYYISDNYSLFGIDGYVEYVARVDQSGNYSISNVRFCSVNITYAEFETVTEKLSPYLESPFFIDSVSGTYETTSLIFDENGKDLLYYDPWFNVTTQDFQEIKTDKSGMYKLKASLISGEYPDYHDELENAPAFILSDERIYTRFYVDLLFPSDVS